MNLYKGKKKMRYVVGVGEGLEPFLGLQIHGFFFKFREVATNRNV